MLWCTPIQTKYLKGSNRIYVQWDIQGHIILFHPRTGGLRYELNRMTRKGGHKIFQMLPEEETYYNVQVFFSFHFSFLCKIFGLLFFRIPQGPKSSEKFVLKKLCKNRVIRGSYGDFIFGSKGGGKIFQTCFEVPCHNCEKSVQKEILWKLRLFLDK